MRKSNVSGFLLLNVELEIPIYVKLNECKTRWYE